jgi:hypothetical protein
MATTVRRLIEKAAQTYGTDSEVALRLGVTRQRLWEWKEGKRTMPMDRFAHLATLAGVNPEKAIASEAIERYGKKVAALALIVSASAAFTPNDASARSRNSTAEPLNPLHIMRSRLGRFLALGQRRRRLVALCGA